MNTVIDKTNSIPNFALNYDEIKQKQQIAWGSGDYGKIGVTLQITGESLCEAMDLHAGQSVLDVAAGNGNATLAAARRFCNVISTDYVEHLLDQSRVRANAEGFAVEYQQADAEALPFPNDSFDNVISTFGVMFTPHQQQSTSELLRVCKPEGKIGLANWTPSSFIGELFKTIGQFTPPPSGLNSPSLWGTEEFVKEHFSPQSQLIRTEKLEYIFRYQSPQHWIDLFREYYGPVHKAFLSLDEEYSNKLEEAIHRLIKRFNVANDGTMIVPSEYLEVVIKKEK